MKFQPSIKGGRKRLSSGVLKDIRRHVENDSRQYNCSMSYVVSTILAEYYGVSEQPKYYKEK